MPGVLPDGMTCGCNEMAGAMRPPSSLVLFRTSLWSGETGYVSADILDRVVQELQTYLDCG
jgi:hypothetical protein